MPDPKPLKELIESRYGDRGGLKFITEAFNGPLRYEDKMKVVGDAFRVSRGQVGKWYSRREELK